MQYPAYSFVQSDDATVPRTAQFFFESIGPKGVIQKAVLFTPIGQDDIVNMALVDVDSITQTLDDKSVSDNGDTAKVLATIFQITHQHLITNPSSAIYFKGNTSARNRLYRMAISQATEELTHYFSMFGLCDQGWEAFRPDRPYEAYLISSK